MIINATTYRFGDVVVDTVAMRVLVRGIPVDLEPKAFRVLLLLIEHPQSAVSKEEIFAAVWPDVAVTDNALTRVIGQIRKTLGDDPKQPRYIETIPTVGYRFIGDLTPLDNPTPTQEAPAPVAISRTRRWTMLLALLMLVVAATTAWWLFRPATAVPPRFASHQVTNSLTLDADPALSPDGSSFVFASDRSGQFELYVRQFGRDSQEIRITTNSGGALQPAWSPDGSKIAFHCLAFGGICTVPALGGPIANLTRYGSRPAWSPDSSHIAFQTSPVTSMYPDDSITYFTSEIYVIGAQSGATPRKLTNAIVRERHVMPAWFSDGSAVLFVNRSEQDSGIAKVSLEGGPITELTTGTFENPVVDSGFLYANRRGESPGIIRWKMNGDGLGKPQMLIWDNRPIAGLSVSRDGRRIVYGLLSTTSNLYKVESKDQFRTLPLGQPEAVTANTSERNTFPSFSPDGSKIAFTQREHGRRLPGVWMMDFPNGAPTLVSNGVDSDFAPKWMGDQIGYISKRGAQWKVVATSPSARSERVLLNINLVGSAATLSQDGKFVALNRMMDGRLRIVIRNLQSGQEQLLPGDGAFPAWTPAGDIVAESYSDGANHVVFWPAADRSLRRQLTEGSELAWPFSASPDSQRIAIAAQRKGSWNLYAVGLDRSQLQLTPESSLRFFVRFPAWSPDGNKIVYELTETRGNVFVGESK